MKGVSFLIITLLSAVGLILGPIVAAAQDAPPATDRAVTLFEDFSAKLDLYYELSYACQSLSDSPETADIRAGCKQHLKSLSEEIEKLWAQLQTFQNSERSTATTEPSAPRALQKGR